jgi:hypothetical protein
MPLYWSQYVGALYMVVFVEFLRQRSELISPDIFLHGDLSRLSVQCTKSFKISDIYEILT